jgi:hypothetical protein
MNGEVRVVSGWVGSSENNAEQDLLFDGGIAETSRAAGCVPSHYRHLAITEGLEGGHPRDLLDRILGLSFRTRWRSAIQNAARFFRE